MTKRIQRVFIIECAVCVPLPPPGGKHPPHCVVCIGMCHFLLDATALPNGATPAPEEERRRDFRIPKLVGLKLMATSWWWFPFWLVVMLPVLLLLVDDRVIRSQLIDDITDDDVAGPDNPSPETLKELDNELQKASRYEEFMNRVYGKIHRGCVCYVPEPGIYHGIDLNRFLGGAHRCEAHIYVCGRKRFGKSPDILVNCSHSHCYIHPDVNPECTCSPKQVQKRLTVCGRKLGKECHKRVKYFCNDKNPAVVGVC